MTSKEILSLLEKFAWSKLNQIYGCAHSSIIGFIAYEWLQQSDKNSLLDGAPSPKIGLGRKGQKNADLLLCKDKYPFIPVEVETTVSKYPEKLQTLFDYKNKFSTINFGLMYLTNLTTGFNKYQHNWGEIKNDICNQKAENRNTIALVSAIKRKVIKEDNERSRLLRRNDYSGWETIQIDYWIFDKNETILEGNFWRE